MIPVKFFYFNKAFFALIKCTGDHSTHKDEGNLATLCFGQLPDLGQWCLYMYIYTGGISLIVVIIIDNSLVMIHHYCYPYHVLAICIYT